MVVTKTGAVVPAKAVKPSETVITAAENVKAGEPVIAEAAEVKANEPVASIPAREAEAHEYLKEVLEEMVEPEAFTLEDVYGSGMRGGFGTRAGARKNPYIKYLKKHGTRKGYRPKGRRMHGRGLSGGHDVLDALAVEFAEAAKNGEVPDMSDIGSLLYGPGGICHEVDDEDHAALYGVKYGAGLADGSAPTYGSDGDSDTDSDGGELTGGSLASGEAPAAQTKRMAGSWMAHLEAVKAENPDLSLKSAMILASRTYHRGG